MKIIYNSIIPFKGYKAINLFGILFVRKGCTMSDVDLNHEAIHTAQIKDFCSLLLIGGIIYYLVYAALFLYQWAKRGFKSWHTAYKANPMEVEAYSNQTNIDYLDTRKRWAWA